MKKYLWKISVGAAIILAVACEQPGPSGDTSAPNIKTATLRGTQLTLTVGEPLAARSEIIGSGGFALTGSGKNPPTVFAVIKIAEVSADATTLTLTLDNAAQAGETVMLSYTQPAADADRIKDKAGNALASLDGTNAKPVTVTPDTSMPGKPTINEIEDTGTGDAYINAADVNGSTGDDTEGIDITFTTGEALRAGDKATVTGFGATAKDYAFSTLTATGTANQYRLTVAKADITDGSKSITVAVTNAAGNAGEASDPKTVTVSTSVLGKPTINEIEDTGTGDPYINAADVNGSTGGDTEGIDITFTTGDALKAGDKATVTGFGDTAKHYLFSALTATGTANQYRLTVAKADIGEGSRNITVAVADDAGNAGAASDPETVTVDTLVPGKPIINVIEDIDTDNTVINAADVNGSTGGDTEGIDITFTTGEALKAGDKAKVTGLVAPAKDYAFSVLTVTGTANQYRLTVAKADIAEGSRSITVAVTDAAGNAGEASNPETVTVDTLVPGKPTINTIEDTGTGDAYIIAADVNGSTGDTEGIDITFTAGEALKTGDKATVTGFGATAKDYAFSTLTAGTGTANLYRLTVAKADIAEGLRNITVAVTDAAGNAGEASGTKTVTVDTLVPGKPTINEIEDTGTGDTYINAAEINRSTDGDTEGIDITFTAGEALKAGDKATVTGFGGTATEKDYAFSTLTAVPGTTNQYRLTVAKADITDGSKSITVAVTDAAGNAGTASDSKTVTVSTSAVGKPNIDTIEDTGADDAYINAADVDGDTEGIDITFSTGDALGAGDKATVTGFGDTAKDYPFSTLTATGTTNQYRLTVAKDDIAEGSKSITVAVTNAAGTAGAASNPKTVTVDTSVPGKPTINEIEDTGAGDTYINATEINGSAGGDTEGIDITFTAGEALETGDKATVTGFGGTAKDYAFSDLTATGTTNQYRLTVEETDIANGRRSITVMVTDAAGNTGTTSDAQTRTVDKSPPPGANTVTSITSSTGTPTYRSATDSWLNKVDETALKAGAFKVVYTFASGSAYEDGTTPVLYQGQTQVGAAPTSKSGTEATFAALGSTASLTSGTDLTLRFKDAAGNLSNGIMAAEVDTEAPNAANAVRTIASSTGTPTYRSATDSWLNKADETALKAGAFKVVYTFDSGSGYEADTTPVLYQGQTQVGTAATSKTGTEATFAALGSTASLTSGTALTLRFKDAAGNLSSGIEAANVDTVAPSDAEAAKNKIYTNRRVDQFSTINTYYVGQDGVPGSWTAAGTLIIDNFLNSSDETALKTASDGFYVKYSHTAFESGSTAVLYQGQTQVGADADWISGTEARFAKLTASLTSGTDLTLKFRDAAGNLSTGVTAAQVDTVAPGPLSVSIEDGGDTYISLADIFNPLGSNSDTDGIDVRFSPRLETGAKVAVTGFGNAAKTFASAGDYSWASSKVTIPRTDITDGSKSITVTVTDAAGNSATSSTYTLTVDTVAPTIQSAKWQSSGGNDIELTMSESLAVRTMINGSGGFSTNTQSITIQTVSVSSSRRSLYLRTGSTPSSGTTLSYTKPSDTNLEITDSAGNPLATTTAITVSDPP